MRITRLPSPSTEAVPRGTGDAPAQRAVRATLGLALPAAITLVGLVAGHAAVLPGTLLLGVAWAAYCVQSFARGRRDAIADLRLTEQRLGSCLETASAHVYAGEILPDGSYRELYTGPGEAALLGGARPPGVSAEQAWERALHPDDHERYSA